MTCCRGTGRASPCSVIDVRERDAFAHSQSRRPGAERKRLTASRQTAWYEPGWPNGKAHAWKACSLWDSGFKSQSWRGRPEFCEGLRSHERGAKRPVSAVLPRAPRVLAIRERGTASWDLKPWKSQPGTAERGEAGCPDRLPLVQIPIDSLRSRLRPVAVRITALPPVAPRYTRLSTFANASRSLTPSPGVGDPNFVRVSEVTNGERSDP